MNRFENLEQRISHLLARRLSRRTLLTTSLATGAGLAVAAGCGREKETVNQAPTPKEGTQTPSIKKTAVPQTSPIEVTQTGVTQPTEIPKTPERPEVLWSFPLERHAGLLSEDQPSFLVSGPEVFFHTQGLKPSRVEIQTGKGGIIGDFVTEHSGTIFGISPNLIFVLRDDRRIYGLDRQTGQTAWNFKLNSPSDNFLGLPKIIDNKIFAYSFAPDPNVYGLHDKSLIALDSSSGTPILKNVLDRETYSDADLKQAVPNSLVFVTGGGIIIQNKDSGQEIANFDSWTPGGPRYKIRDNFLITPDLAIAPDGYTVTAKSVVKYDLEKQQVAWTTPGFDLVYNTGIFGPVVFANLSSDPNHSTVQALDFESGTPLWTLGVGLPLGASENLIFTNAKEAGTVYGLNAQTGEAIWGNDEVQADKIVFADSNDLVLLGPTILYHLDAQSGSITRKEPVISSASFSSAVVKDEGVFFTIEKSLKKLNKSTRTIETVPVLLSEPIKYLRSADGILLGEGAKSLEAIRVS